MSMVKNLTESFEKALTFLGNIYKTPDEIIKDEIQKEINRLNKDAQKKRLPIEVAAMDRTGYNQIQKTMDISITVKADNGIDVLQVRRVTIDTSTERTIDAGIRHLIWDYEEEVSDIRRGFRIARAPREVNMF